MRLLITCSRAPMTGPCDKPPTVGKTSDENSASLTQYRSDRADLLTCALTSGVPTNRQKGRAINTHANRRLAVNGLFSFLYASVSKCNRCSRSISKVRDSSENQARRNTLFSDASSAECSKTTQRKHFEMKVLAAFCKYCPIDVKKKKKKRPQ